MQGGLKFRFLRKIDDRIYRNGLRYRAAATADLSSEQRNVRIDPLTNVPRYGAMGPLIYCRKTNDSITRWAICCAIGSKRSRICTRVFAEGKGNGSIPSTRRVFQARGLA